MPTHPRGTAMHILERLLAPVTLLGSGLLVAETMPTPFASENFWKWAFTQGGLIIVVLVLLWYIGSTKKRESDTATTTINVLMEAVSKSSAAVEKASDAIRSSTEASVQIERSLRTLATQVERIAEDMEGNHLCPVTRVSEEELRAAIREEVRPRGAATGQAIARVISERLKDEKLP